jgi:hypothetical protein
MYIEHFIVFKAKSVHRLSFSDIHRVNCSLPIFSSLCLSRESRDICLGRRAFHFLFSIFNAAIYRLCTVRTYSLFLSPRLSPLAVYFLRVPYSIFPH